MRYYVTIGEVEHCVELLTNENGRYTCTIDDAAPFETDVIQRGNQFHLLSGQNTLSIALSLESGDMTLGGPRRNIQVESASLRAIRSATGASSGLASDGLITSPMPGRVVKNLVSEGDRVTVGQGVVVVEAMKMENELKATMNGAVIKVHAAADDLVEANAPLIEIEPDD